MLSELESVARGVAWRRAIPAWPLARRHAVAAGLTGLVAASVAIRIALVRQVPAPFFFMDELGYEQMARSLGHAGQLAIFGKHGSTYAPLYPVLIAPIYALTDSAPRAYEWAKIVNAVLMSLSVLPVYGIARFVLTRPRALGVAALSAIAPLMFYANLELSENLAYPLTLLAIWAMLHALRDPRPRNDALLIGASLLATAARFQEVALFPAALTAALVVSRRQTFRRHKLLLSFFGVAAAAFVIRTIANGGNLPLAGRYSIVGRVRPSALHVLEVAVQNLAGLDFALGVIPFAAALVAAYALARRGFPRDGLLFGAVAAATTFWFLLVVAYDAAAFEHSYVQHVGQQLPRDGARIHERYLIYLVPFFLVALVAALRVARPKVSARVHLLAIGAAALLPALIPFRTVINNYIVAESFGLLVLGKNVNGSTVAYGHAVLVVLAITAVIALMYFYAFLRPRPSFAVVITVFVFLIFSSLVRVKILGASRTIADAPAHASWVDQAVHGAKVAIVSAPGTNRAAVVETAFENFSVSQLYYVCTPAFESDFGDLPLAADGSGALHARYAVVPRWFAPRGRVIDAWPAGGLVLVEPAGGVVRVPAVACT